MEALKAWWMALTGRERLLIGLMLATLLLVGLYLFGYRPVMRYHAQAQAAYGAASAMLAEVAQGVAQAQTMQARADQRAEAEGTGGNLRALAGRLAQETGLTINRLQPGEQGRLTLWLDGTNMPSLARWLGRLEREHGVVVTRALVTTARSGAGVDAQVELSRGAGI